MKLNLGSGDVPLIGYVNVDRCYGGDKRLDARIQLRGEIYPLAFADSEADEIRASHCLEHLPWRDTMNAIKEWVRVLKPGGVLKIAVPDFEWICRQYLAEVDTDAAREPRLTAYLMGGQKDENDYHKAIFDARGLKSGMELAGLVDVGPWDGDRNDCSGLAVSLNLQGTKPHHDIEIMQADRPLDEYSHPSHFEGWVNPHSQGASDNIGQSAEPFGWLRTRAYNKYTQWGEDGLLEAIFSKIGTTNRTVIECGAGDPVRGSNSRKLIEEGWQALLVEPDEKKRAALFAEYGDHFTNKQVKIVPYYAAARTEPRNGRFLVSMDDILTQNSIPETPDLLVIDVDGQDWYLWNGLIHHRPRVVVIEWGQQEDIDFIPEEDGPGQAGSRAIEQLAALKGYEPIVCTGYNFICVDRELLPMLGAEPVVLFNPKEVACVLSVPRLGFMSNMQCLLTVATLGIQVRTQQGAFWGQCLTEAMLLFMDEPGYKYILTVDYDSIFTADDVLNLYRYMASPGGEGIDALTSVQVRRENDNVLLTMADADGKPRDRVGMDEMQQDVVRVRTAHFGLTLFRVDALRRLPHPWFLDVPDEDGKWGTGKLDCDIAFWQKWQSAGNSLYLAPRVAVGHLEQVVSWPDMSLRTTFQRMKDYQKHGKPASVWK